MGFSLPKVLMKSCTVVQHLEILVLEETVEKLQCSSSGPLQKEGNTISPEIQMFVYDAIINHVQTRNVPSLLGKFAQQFGLNMDMVPHHTTIEMMARELGVVSDLQAAEMVMTNTYLTLVFAATTQGFVNFLVDAGIPCGLIPRYRVNRLHILFQILLCPLFATAPCGGLQALILADVARGEKSVLGLIGKLPVIKDTGTKEWCC
ncbi:hypothetical protein LSH36_70g06049 [Paralvinella palmiformis]|uniref:Uncharacterized protein n=1 Tax=Paralvinella palmiformis TaxID=53620 RepID=A0AAD9NBD1_9ANNE|nr:hypothetical protein LSH36_70g06049 [Paralvinella palmiformis]